MAIKILLLLTLVTACGQNTQVSNKSQLEGTSFVTMPTEEVYTHSGTLQRKTNSEGSDVIIINNIPYTVDFKSSYSSLEFIAALPLGTAKAVKCKGKITAEKILLETLVGQ